MKNGEGGVFFFFNVEANLEDFIYSHDIPEIYNLDEEQYYQENHKLLELVNKLQQKFVENGPDAWESIVMIVNEDRKLEIHFNYTNWNESEFGPSKRISFFEYKYLNRKPKNEKEEDIFSRMEKFEVAE